MAKQNNGCKTNFARTAPAYGKGKTKAGNRVHSGTKLIDGDGVVVKTLLTPAGKGAKYADELKNNRRITHDGQVKTNSCGCVQELTPEQRAYRGGYLAAQKRQRQVPQCKSGKAR